MLAPAVLGNSFPTDMACEFFQGPAVSALRGEGHRNSQV